MLIISVNTTSRAKTPNPKVRASSPFRTM